MSFASNLKNDKLYQTNERYEHLSDTSNFWVSNQALINQYKPVNLGIGFPDYNGYKNLKNIATEVINDSDHKIHQYTRVEGHLPLCNAVAKYYFKKHGLIVNPLNEILITPGGDGALHYISLAFLNKGDEIILFEPFFLNYQFTFEPSGATLVYVGLKYNKILDENGYYQSSDWTWDDKELEAAFSSKTKIVLINSPNNPLGKVFNDNELKKIVQLCIKYNALLLSDEVYENYIFNESCTHLKIIEKFPEIRDRTLTIGSAGKTFGITGAKTGWIIGCQQLVKQCTIAHTNSLYVLSTLIQEILARCFETELAKIDSPDCHFNQISADIKPKRDRLARLLRDAGFIPIIPDGGIFILADFSKIAAILKKDSDDQMDVYFNKYLIKKGLASFPASKFFSSSNSTGENLIRFCFFKTDATLDLAAKVLSSIIDTK